MPLLSLKNDRLPLLFELEDPGKVRKLFCELQNILPKALLFITKDLNWPSVYGNKVILYYIIHKNTNIKKQQQNNMEEKTGRPIRPEWYLSLKTKTKTKQKQTKQKQKK